MMKKQHEAYEPYQQYKTDGYSAKHRISLAFGAISGIMVSAAFLIIIVNMTRNVEPETWKVAGTMLVYGLAGIVLLAGGLGLALIFSYIRQPGQQLPESMSRIEKLIEGGVS